MKTALVALIVGYGLDLLLEAFLDQFAVGLMEVAYGSLEAGLVRHDIPHVAAVQFGDGQHERMEW